VKSPPFRSTVAREPASRPSTGIRFEQEQEGGGRHRQHQLGPGQPDERVAAAGLGDPADSAPDGPHGGADGGVGQQPAGMVGQMRPDFSEAAGEGEHQGPAHADAVTGAEDAEQKHGVKIEG
jgi:hypothetical protein